MDKDEELIIAKKAFFPKGIPSQVIVGGVVVDVEESLKRVIDALCAPKETKLGSDICMNGRLFLRQLAETMGVIDVTADPNEVQPISEVMTKMLERAREDRERWHMSPSPQTKVCDSYSASLGQVTDVCLKCGHKLHEHITLSPRMSCDRFMPEDKNKLGSPCRTCGFPGAQHKRPFRD